MDFKTDKQWQGEQDDFWSWIGLNKRPCYVNTGEAPCSMISYEMLQYPGNQKLSSQGNVDGDSNISAWLNKDLTTKSIDPASLDHDVTPVAGHRILFGTLHYEASTHRVILPFGEKTYAKLKQKLGLPPDFRYLISKKGSRSLEHTTQIGDNTLKCFIYKFVLHQPTYYHLVLSHSTTTNLTHGILLSLKSTHHFPSLIHNLHTRHLQYNPSEPLLLANLVAELVIDNCAQQIELQDETLNKLEEEMGQHKHLNRPVGNPLEMDFKEATQSLNFVSRTLGLVGLRLGGVLLTLGKIWVDSREMGNGRSGEEEGEGEGMMMMGRLEAYLGNYCRQQELRAAYEEKRVKTQSAAIYSFVAQKDAKTNIELAESMAVLAMEARGDNKVMKAIAVLGMFFLPGTFVAAVFAMPLVDWSGAVPVVNPGFKYYWAVAVPLTITVLICWAVFTHTQYWQKTPRTLTRARSSSHDIEKAMMGHSD